MKTKQFQICVLLKYIEKHWVMIYVDGEKLPSEWALSMQQLSLAVLFNNIT
jgi:hypothetical protein